MAQLRAGEKSADRPRTAVQTLREALSSTYLVAALRTLQTLALGEVEAIAANIVSAGGVGCTPIPSATANRIDSDCPDQ